MPFYPTYSAKQITSPNDLSSVTSAAQAQIDATSAVYDPLSITSATLQSQIDIAPGYIKEYYMDVATLSKVAIIEVQPNKYGEIPIRFTVKCGMYADPTPPFEIIHSIKRDPDNYWKTALHLIEEFKRQGYGVDDGVPEELSVNATTYEMGR